MKKLNVIMTLLATTSTVLAVATAKAAAPPRAAALEEPTTAADQIARNYGLCQELRFRMPSGEEEFIIQRSCTGIIKLHELKIEKEALLRRIKAIDAESVKVQKELDRLGNEIL